MPATNLVFSSPHSGRNYPESLVERSPLGLLKLRASEDALVDQLFAAAPDHGAPLLSGLMPRAYLDLNRAPDELDPALIEGAKVSGINQRVLAGLGVVPRVVAEATPIYNGKISMAEARARINTCHLPFHDMLNRLLLRARDHFGSALLIDCHSMPSEALRAAPKVNGVMPDIVLGDRFGAAAGRNHIAEVQAAFQRAGFTVARNAPFAGGYITQRYGKPAQGFHAIQVEIDRGLYLDQARIEAGPAFDEVRELLTRVIAELIDLSREMRRVAAE
ncbi:N-formylglutamate amidohydrolase [Rhodobacteraceae bacterium NNCM2]|nr:N-formylglutamate amidohydrolase [Coraliihabitans acroporae]